MGNQCMSPDEGQDVSMFERTWRGSTYKDPKGRNLTLPKLRKGSLSKATEETFYGSEESK